MHFSRDQFAHILAALLASRLDALRPGQSCSLAMLMASPFNQAPLSLSRETIAALAMHVIDAMELDELVQIDTLLASPWLDRWVLLTQAAWAMPRHSGSMLLPSVPCSGVRAWPWRELWATGGALANLIASRAQIRRVVNLVPPTDAGAVIGGLLLAEWLCADSCDDRLVPPRELMPTITAGDLIVVAGCDAEGLLSFGPDRDAQACFPPCSVLAVGTPLCSSAWLSLRAAGVSDVLELFATTQGGPVAWREGFDQPYSLLPQFVRQFGSSSSMRAANLVWASRITRDDGTQTDLHLAAKAGQVMWLDHRRFIFTDAHTEPQSTPAHTEAVAAEAALTTASDPRLQLMQLADRCRHVAMVLRGHPAVRDAAVRPRHGSEDSTGNIAIVLHAYIIPRYSPADELAMLSLMQRHAAAHLPACDVPESIILGPCLTAQNVA